MVGGDERASSASSTIMLTAINVLAFGTVSYSDRIRNAEGIIKTLLQRINRNGTSRGDLLLRPQVNMYRLFSKV